MFLGLTYVAKMGCDSMFNIFLAGRWGQHKLVSEAYGMVSINMMFDATDVYSIKH